MAEDASAGAVAAIDAVDGFEIALTSFDVAEGGFEVQILGNSGAISDLGTKGFELRRQLRE